MQELSGHLAAEITRLCSLAKQDALQLNQGMDVYEMEVSLVYIHSCSDVKTQEGNDSNENERELLSNQDLPSLLKETTII